MENHGKDMENPWKIYGKPWKRYGKPWKRYGKPSKIYGKPWKTHGKSMENHGKYVENHGKDMENHGKYVENHGKYREHHSWYVGNHPMKWLGNHSDMGDPRKISGWLISRKMWKCSRDDFGLPHFGKPLFLALLQVGGRPKRRSVALIQVNEIWQFTQMPAAHCDVSWRFYLIWIIWIYLDLTKSNSNHNSEDLFWNVFFTYAKSFHLGRMYKSM